MALNSYLVGNSVVLIGSCEVVNPLDQNDKTPTDPTTVTFYRLTPDGVLTTYTQADPEVTHLATGIDACTVPVLQVGTEKWRYETTGTCEAAAEDWLDVDASSVIPCSGPCTDWLTGGDVMACCGVEECDNPSLFDQVAAEAQELLFQLSGRQFAGTCERTVRPCRTRCGCGFQVLSRGYVVAPYGWYWYGSDWWWNGTSCGCRPLSTVKLSGHPVQEILEVKIDGAVVGPATYRLDRKRDLVRVRDPAAPDVVLRWPACQMLDLDDTQPGTFSITYTYGAEPPLSAVSAAAELACELYKSCSGLACKLPTRTIRTTRQGVTVDRTAFVTWGFQSGKSRGLPRGWNTGLPLVDAFMGAANPAGLIRRPVFWSPAAALQYPLPVESTSSS